MLNINAKIGPGLHIKRKANLGYGVPGFHMLL